VIVPKAPPSHHDTSTPPIRHDAGVPATHKRLDRPILATRPPRGSGAAAP
jgi:hypothetical protein